MSLELRQEPMTILVSTEGHADAPPDGERIRSRAEAIRFAQLTLRMRPPGLS